MTEEIIIDGVNVAGCFNLDEWKHCNICQELIKNIPNRRQCLIEEELRCEFYTNCHYKQLKRLEQENKELKEMLSKEPKAMQAFQISYSGLKRDNETLWGMVKDYKSTLEEIRNYCDRIEQGSVIGTQDCLINSIKNITNEVLNV